MSRQLALFALFATISCAPVQQAIKEEPRPVLFPSANELANVVNIPLAAEELPSSTLEVETWTLVGPFEDGAGTKPHPTNTKIGALFVERTAGKIQTSLAMECVAREVGTFYLETGKYPASALGDFIAGRCGAPILGIGVDTFGNDDLKGKTDEETLFKHWKSDLDKMIDTKTKRERPAGVWFGKKDNKAYFFLASGPKASSVESVVASSSTPGVYTVRGKLDTQAAGIRALVNIGPYKMAECAKNVTLELPTFEVECATDPKDSMAWIEIAAFPPGRVLGTTAANVLVSPNGAISNVYSRAKYGMDQAVTDAASITAHLPPAINRVRAQAGMGPLEVEVEQSATVAQVAEHYFAAMSGQIDPTVADVVVLGVRAGWNVKAMIRYGAFTTAASAIGGNIDDLLGSALERPFGREALLDPNLRKLALGPVWSEREKYFGVLLTTYALFEKEEQQKLKWKVFETLGKQRKRAGTGTPTVLFPLEDTARDIVAAVEAGQASPRFALQRLIDETARAAPYRTIEGWVFETESIEGIDFPKALLTIPQLKIVTAVAAHRFPDEPWGRYIVFVVYEAPPPVTTTQVEPVDREHPVFARSP